MARAAFGALLACVVLAGVGCRTQGSRLPQVARAESIELESPAFPDGGPIPAEYTCDGADVSPPLAWGGGPPAEEYVLVAVDADAADFVHWVVVGIPPTVTSVPEGGLPPGAREGVNDFDRVGYGGPCPPKGETHRYVFTVYSLRSPRADRVPSGATLEEVLDAVSCCIQAQGTLVGAYRRP
ncbi:MAG TPA: YbhB/YbcL family Raf kinase inhibitor-like protein [Actinomycetota bacterium]|nr:YbhB/YbcL family Raf kinase inhibitor-like protein [Actinomycetota bacterium]